MTTKYGVFEEPGYIGPVLDKGNRAPKGAARSPRPPSPAGFRVPASKSGKNNDATFSAFSSLHTEDPYKQRQRRKLHDGPAFKPAGKSLEKAAVIEQRPPALPQKPADTVHEQRGIFTNPAKKGGFGFVGTTLSERAGSRGVVGEYEHTAPGQPTRAGTSELGKQPELTPFRSAVKPQRAVSGAMTDPEWQPRLQVQEQAGVQKDNPVTTPFRPPHGGGKTFSPHPEHEPVQLVAAAAASDIDDMNKGMHGRPWIHTASNHSGPTRSIVGMNVT